MAIVKNLDLPKDRSGKALPAVALAGTPLHLTVGASSTTGSIPSGSPIGSVIRVSATADCYIKFGAGSQTATNADFIMPRGVEYFKVPDGATDIGCIRVENTDSGHLEVAQVR